LVFTKNYSVGRPDFCANKKNKIMYPTAQLLENLHQQTEQHLQKAVSEWQMLSPERLGQKASPEKWSVAQCLEHLNIYGRYYLPAMEQAIQKAKQRNSQATPTFRSGWLGAYFTGLMMPQTDGKLKTKMKSPKNAIPSPAPDPRAMLAEFIDQQETMLRLLREAASVNLSVIRIPISISPWIKLKLGDTFQFVVAHIQRHVVQAEQALQLDRQPTGQVFQRV